MVIRGYLKKYNIASLRSAIAGIHRVATLTSFASAILCIQKCKCLLRVNLLFIRIYIYIYALLKSLLVGDDWRKLPSPELRVFLQPSLRTKQEGYTDQRWSVKYGNPG